MKDSISITERNVLVKSYIAALKNAGMDDRKDNNVYPLGQQFHPTGLKLVELKINGKKAVYVAVTTKENFNIPIKSLMGISSLSGYEITGVFDSVSRKDGKKVVTKVKAEVVDGFDFGRVFQPSCRQLLDFIAVADEQHFFEGKILTYLGKAVRPYEARKDSPVTSLESTTVRDSVLKPAFISSNFAVKIGLWTKWNFTGKFFNPSRPYAREANNQVRFLPTVGITELSKIKCVRY